MNKRYSTIFWTAALVCLCGFDSGPVRAQQSPPTTNNETSEPPGAEATPEGSASSEGATEVGVRPAPPEPPPPPPAPQYLVRTYDAENPPQVAYGAPDPRFRRHVQISLYLGVPVWLSGVGDVLSPGFSFDGRVGWDLGFFVPEISFGTQYNWFNDPSFRDTGYMSSWRIGFGGRFQFINRSIFTPFVSGAFDLNFWHISGDTSLSCGYYYCREVNNYDFAPGFSSRAGVLFDILPMFGIEVGLRLAMTFEGNLFDSAQSWLTPYFGGTLFF